jgi:hypothetical protein
VYRDDEKNRFLVYIECTSQFGQFNFNIFCRFHFDKNLFASVCYNDDKTVKFYGHVDSWEHLVQREQVERVKEFFNTTNNYYMGDQYYANQAGAQGPNALAQNNTFNRVINPLPANTDYARLSEELDQLRQLLVTKASLPEHYKAIGEVAEAETAAKGKDGNKVLSSLKAAGKWVLDAAKDVGTDVLAEVIKKSMGLH